MSEYLFPSFYGKRQFWRVFGRLSASFDDFGRYLGSSFEASFPIFRQYVGTSRSVFRTFFGASFTVFRRVFPKSFRKESVDGIQKSRRFGAVLVHHQVEDQPAVPQKKEVMPRKPKRPCSYPGCPNLTDGQYCEEHRTQARQQYDKYERAPRTASKYGRAWHRIRARYAAAHPLCEQCLREGRYTPVEEVHHIIPISRGGTHADSNLMSLCQSCHNKIHHELGDR